MHRTAGRHLIATFCFVVGCASAQAADNKSFYDACYKGDMAVLAEISKKGKLKDDYDRRRSIATRYCACLGKSAPVRRYTWKDVVAFAGSHQELVERCLGEAR